MARDNHRPNSNQTSMSFMEILNLFDLKKLINGLINNDPMWPNMPNKLPFDIPNFESKPREGLSNYIMSFYLWCSCNSIMEDLIRLRILQHTLMGVATKW